MPEKYPKQGISNHWYNYEYWIMKFSNENDHSLVAQIESKGVAVEDYASILDKLLVLFEEKKSLSITEIRQAFEVVR